MKYKKVGPMQAFNMRRAASVPVHMRKITIDTPVSEVVDIIVENMMQEIKKQLYGMD